MALNLDSVLGHLSKEQRARIMHSLNAKRRRSVIHMDITKTKYKPKH